MAGKWKPKVGRVVEVINGDHCGGKFEDGQVGEIRSIDCDESFTVEANNDYWWFCRECTRPTKRVPDGAKSALKNRSKSGKRSVAPLRR